MGQDQSANNRLPKGVSMLASEPGRSPFSGEDPPQGGRGPPGDLRVGRAGRVRVQRRLGGDRAGVAAPEPGPRRVSSRTRRGSGGLPVGSVVGSGSIPPPKPIRRDPARSRSALLTLFEVTVVGFWRDQAAQSDAGPGLDAASSSAGRGRPVVFWSPSIGHPSPSEAIARLVARRVDQAFRRADLTRAILDDDGDDDWRVARWLACPTSTRSAGGFATRSGSSTRNSSRTSPARRRARACRTGRVVLGVDPPFSASQGPRSLPGPIEVGPPRRRRHPRRIRPPPGRLRGSPRLLPDHGSLRSAEVVGGRWSVVSKKCFRFTGHRPPILTTRDRRPARGAIFVIMS